MYHGVGVPDMVRGWGVVVPVLVTGFLLIVMCGVGLLAAHGRTSCAVGGVFGSVVLLALGWQARPWLVVPVAGYLVGRLGGRWLGRYSDGLAWCIPILLLSSASAFCQSTGPAVSNDQLGTFTTQIVSGMSGWQTDVAAMASSFGPVIMYVVGALVVVGLVIRMGSRV